MGTLSKSWSEMSLVERLRSIKSRPLLICDISSSMSEDVEPGKTKIEALRDIVSNLKGNFKVMAFNDQVQDCTKDDIPGPRGGTCLSPAFRKMKELGIKKAVVITDGDVNYHDKEFSLETIEGLEIKFIYVGPDSAPPDFLKDLAKKSGGFCDQDDLKAEHQAALSEKIQNLLGPGPENSGSIQL